MDVKLASRETERERDDLLVVALAVTDGMEAIVEQSVLPGESCDRVRAPVV